MISYFIICLAATALGAVSGIGGWIIIKPVMDVVSDIPVETVSFLSGCTVLAMSIVSMLRSYGDGAKVDKNKSTLLALGAAADGIVCKSLFDFLKVLLQMMALSVLYRARL